MLAIVRYMMFVGIGALVLVAVYAAVTGINAIDILTFAVIFLMGAVPVALPAVMTIVQSFGARELAKKGILVTRLDSIEDAASIDIICLDKTGTITQNRLSVGSVISFQDYSEADVKAMAALASQSGKDAIDTAILDDIKVTGIDISHYQQVSFTPFEPSTKRSEAMITTEGKQFKVIKGAPQTVLALCHELDETTKLKIDQAVEEMAKKGTVPWVLLSPAVIIYSSSSACSPWQIRLE